MRPLILKMDISLDGFVGQPGGDPSWLLSYYDDELSAYMADFIGRAGTHVMGRHTYGEMAQYWPASTEPFAKPMNEIPKAVFSTTLQEATWAETTIYRDIEAGIAELKAQDGGPLVAYGGARFVQELTRLRLIDEYRLNLHPVALHDGYKPFGAELKLGLVEARTFPSGTVALTYA
jgi:dihydrofolate reductase